MRPHLAKPIVPTARPGYDATRDVHAAKGDLALIEIVRTYAGADWTRGAVTEYLVAEVTTVSRDGQALRCRRAGTTYEILFTQITGFVRNWIVSGPAKGKKGAKRPAGKIDVAKAIAACVGKSFATTEEAKQVLAPFLIVDPRETLVAPRPDLEFGNVGRTFK